MKKQDKSGENVTLSRRDYENIQQRLVATQNLTLILQEKENEISQLNHKLKSLEQNLLETHKLLGKMTFQKCSSPSVGGDSGVGNSRTPDSGIGGASVSSPSQMSSVVVDGDLGIITQQDGTVPTAHHQGKLTSGMHPEKEAPNSSFWQLSKEPVSNIRQDKVSQSREDMEVISFQPNSYRRMQSLSDIWSLNSTVSKPNFYAAVRELKKTKACLREALSKSDAKIVEVMKTANYVERIKSQEERIATLTGQVNSLMEERDLLHKQIEGFQHFKRSLREETEGVSVPPPAMSPEELGRWNEGRIQNAACRTSSTGSSGSTVVSNPKSPLSCSGESESSSESRLREKKLQDDLNHLTADYSCMKKERDDLKAQYETLLRSIQDIERRTNESQLMREKQELLEDNINMRRELKDLQEENASFLKSIETVSNNLSREGQKNLRLKAELENQRLEHQSTVYRQHEQFIHMTQKIDSLTRENQHLRLQLESEFSASASSPHGLIRSDSTDAKSDPSHEYGRNYRGQVYTCDHCYMEFYDEKEHIEHFQKCAP